MSVPPRLDYIAAGGNRHPSAADWKSGLLAFGAGNNIALWNPDGLSKTGIYTLLNGHTDTVNAISIVDFKSQRYIISGSSDNNVRVWIESKDHFPSFVQTACLAEHTGAINTISALEDHGVFVTGAADGTAKFWQLSGADTKVFQSIALKPRFLPLATALVALPTGDIVLAVAGTTVGIQLYSRPSTDLPFVLQATLAGHEGWIRSLDFLNPQEAVRNDVILASASQDKYVRLWRFHRNVEPTLNGSSHKAVQPLKQALSNKAHQVGSATSKYAVTFEALLIGHEDWIYSARWAPATADRSSPILLTASADNSLSMWSREEASGLWVCDTRLGEISSQKGSTTATGSTGGFWVGLWQPEGKSVASLGRTGSWRRWSYDRPSDSWLQQLGTSGHTEDVQGLSWAGDGSYLMSTGLDQTTRLYAQWHRDDVSSWHEMSRPQIHGYDLNCIASTYVHQFTSGAEEKLLRVFNKPKAIDTLLARLSGKATEADSSLPETADIPVLGLSNKAITATTNDESAGEPAVPETDENEATNAEVKTPKSVLDLDQPPFEDHLARHTLWPEHEKLYGHGYEISAVASNYAGTVIATACKASSLDHAVIRLYETKEWREVKPPLSAHSLTVTSLSFSADDKYLLSTGRDRQWALFTKAEDSDTEYKLLKANPKGHSRMILDCTWAPTSIKYVFATAGRDKSVKIWSVENSEVNLVKTFAIDAPVTAVSFSPSSEPHVCLAYGTEEGRLGVMKRSGASWDDVEVELLAKGLGPSKAVTSLRWRPDTGSGETSLLAVASEDGSVRLLQM